MKRILAPIQSVYKLCGEQLPCSQTEYVLSQHCVWVDCEDGRLLYHVMTGELLLLGMDESLDQERDMLVKQRFLVPKSLDECAHLQQVQVVARLLQPKSAAKTHFTVLTTTDCNARCAYCYERGIARETMTDQVAHDVANYIARSCGGNEVSIHWFGGEPLYNKDAINIIARGLRDAGVPLRSHMTSNGYYFDAETAAQAKQLWNLEHVQITLDGTEDRYNRTKAYIDAGESAYQRVLANIDTVLDEGILVYVRLNMDSRNVADLEHVCDMLATRYAGKNNLKVTVQPLRSLAAKVHEFEGEDEAYDSFMRIVQRLETYGLLSSGKLRRSMQVNSCKADSREAEVILPNGDVAKCEHFDPHEHIGTIYESWRDKALLASWAKVAEPRPECTTCPLLWQCNRLERCAWWKSGCDSSIRRMRLYNLQRHVQATYDAYKQGVTVND